MKTGKGLSLALAAAIALFGSFAWAEGDAAKGKTGYKKCKACHTIEEGGKNKIGPNLFAIGGRQAGIVPKYKYSKSYVTAGEKGLVWTEENLVEYLADPKAFIRQASGDPKGRTKMPLKLKKEETRRDVAAYLMTQK
ncbi:MAG: c-type cytochrome [Proteobacteria bacterium]|nr:c-type cytochrome [Pseudomonadota bacterium]